MLEIRPLKIEDAAALAALDELVFSEPWSRQEFEKLLTREYCTYAVATVCGEIVGCAGYVNLAREADIDKVVVKPEFRKQGIASKLLEAILAWGEKQAVEAYTLEVRVSNTNAIGLYEKYGFVSEGIRPGFYDKPKEDAMIMWKRK